MPIKKYKTNILPRNTVMNTINPRSFFVPREGNEVGYYGGSQLVITPTSQDWETDLTFQTKEGDKVTLTSVVQSSGMVARDRDNALLDKNVLWISVKGELSDQELADIHNALDAIDQGMKKSLLGGTPNSLNLEEYNSLERAEGSVLYKPGQLGGNLTTAKSKEQFNKEAGRLLNEHFEKKGAELVETLEKAEVEPRQAVQPINDIFSNLIKEYAGTALSDKATILFIKDIHSSLLEKLQGSSLGKALSEIEAAPNSKVAQYLKLEEGKDSDIVKLIL